MTLVEIEAFDYMHHAHLPGDRWRGVKYDPNQQAADGAELQSQRWWQGLEGADRGAGQ
jgi:hypothetical protein